MSKLIAIVLALGVVSAHASSISYVLVFQGGTQAFPTEQQCWDAQSRVEEAGIRATCVRWEY